MKYIKKLLIALCLFSFIFLIPIKVNSLDVLVYTPRGVTASSRITNNIYGIDEIEEYREEDFTAHPNI